MSDDGKIYGFSGTSEPDDFIEISDVVDLLEDENTGVSDMAVFCIKRLRARLTELEAEKAELVKDRERLAEIHAFLLGEGPLEGCWFHEKPSQSVGNFWWRSFLRAAIQDAAREGE